MSIQRDALILNLQIGLWTARRLDKSASRKLTDDAGAQEGAANVNKHLIPKDAMQPMQTAASAIRQHFYDCTLPWRDNGDRLLTRKMFMDFMNKHGQLVDTFKREVETFATTTYASALAKAEFRMGDLFNPDDYPTAADMKRRFYVNLDLDAVMDVKDFRVQLEDDQLAELKDQMEAALGQRITRAMSDLWQRLYTALEHYAERMDVTGKDKSIFRDTTVTNLKSLIEIIPALNVTDDPDLEEIRSDIEKYITGWEPNQLRELPDARAQVAAYAKDVLEDMKGYMGAWKRADA